MGLRDVGDTLPPGFRFYPSDEELVCHYLYKKIANEEVLRGTLVEIDLHVCEPWQLPDVAKLNSNEWYFFSFRDRKYATGFRTNRATNTGYWKATGKDRAVLDPKTQAVVGMRKTLVFYRNRAPNGIKTGWIMHEFRLENPNVPPKEDWVLCRVFHKSRSGEDSNTLISPNDLYDSTAGATSLNLAASPPTKEYVMPCGYQDKNVITSFPHCPSHLQSQNPSTSLGLWAIEPPAGYLELSHHDMYVPHLASSNYADDHNKMVETNYTTKCEDDYEFMFDFHGSNGVPSSLEDVEFDYSNGSVFV